MVENKGFYINAGEDWLNTGFKQNIEENYMKSVSKMEEYILGAQPPEEFCVLADEMVEANKAVKAFVWNLRSADGETLEEEQINDLYQSNRYHLFDAGDGNFFIARGKEVPT